MQVERDIERKTFFDTAEKFNMELMEERLNETNVMEVHVFKSTPQNLKFAALRKEFRNKSRKELRELL